MSELRPTMSDEGSNLPELPTFPPGEKVCANCKLWQPHSVDHRGWVGPCRLQPQRGLFPPSAPICDAFVAKGSAAKAAADERPRAPRAVRSVAPVVMRRGEPTATTGAAPAPSPVRLPERHTPLRSEAWLSETVDLGGELTMTREELMDLFREASGDGPAPPLASKWEGGVIQMVPSKPELQAKELPIDSLFHKVVMVRDRLRTLEQKINAHPKLTDAEKVEMQQYITRVYGSLTTFNHLFRDKADQFVGSKGDE